MKHFDKKYMLVVGLLVFCFCTTGEEQGWEVNLSNIGFTSSPRAIDLNGDDVLDLVVGGGSEEFTRTNHGVMSIDGKNGNILWSVPARNQVVGSAIFKDINEDGIPDVFIGGRSAIFMAIDGFSGEVIWEYLKDSPSMDLVNDTTLLNFFTPQFVPDIDSDGYADILTAFGGFVKAKANDLKRPCGSLMILSGKTGTSIHQFSMPDGAETYMSPLVYDFAKDGNQSIVFGSGGEKINGHLYRIPLFDMLKNDLSNLEILAQGNGKGFIAPPALADVNQDGTLDIIASPVNGNMLCLDGLTGQTIWQIEVAEEFEVYTMPAPGHFSQKDNVPDFFSSMGSGPWPDTKFTQHIVVDGSTGKIVFSDTLGLFQYASPIVWDMDKDGQDEVILAINDRVKLENISQEALFYINQLKVLNLNDGIFSNFGKMNLGSNLGATPLIGDLDHDRRPEIVYCFMEDANNFYSFQKGKIELHELNLKLDSQIPWGTYMGLNFDGVFLNNP